MLSEKDMATGIRNFPLVSIDLIIRNKKDEVLLARRNQEPAKELYFVPGGRIRKDESIEAAFNRILKDETNLNARFEDARSIGFFEHRYTTNRFEVNDFGTHYIVLAYEIIITEIHSLQLNQYHSDPKWMTDEQVIASGDAHDFAKQYFRARKNDEFLIGATITYETLMQHYIHYDSQLWSRTQLLIAVQGAAWVGAYETRFSILGSFLVFIVAASISAAVWRLIWIDRKSGRVNQTMMDNLAILIKQHSLGRARLRADVPKVISGFLMVNIVTGTFIAINILGSAVAIYWPALWRSLFSG